MLTVAERMEKATAIFDHEIGKARFQGWLIGLVVGCALGLLV